VAVADDGIFGFEDYKKYLAQALKARSRSGRGGRSELAAAARCQTSYVSRVLNGAAHFSLEQGMAISQYLGHTREEGQCFLLLLQLARAGTPALRAHHQEDLDRLREQRLVIKNRLKIQSSLSREDQATYYSAWYYAAVHVIVGIEKYRTRDAIAEYLRLPPGQVAKTLEFLAALGLIATAGAGRYKPGAKWLHLERDSPMIAKHHVNWRLVAMQSLDRPHDADLHYSVVVRMSDDDVAKVKALAVTFVQQANALIDASKDEGLHCLNLDFLRV
jgi:uncharacterized protein (TIGR02147 family)